ncbi:MAG: peptidylprolyl isomerase [Chloroflexi bacterium]|nr:peptidylprolyl isomerase [Chloroflexota bacterium]
MVRASHILVGTRDTTTQLELNDEKKATKRKVAEDLMARARKGEDFAKLAREFSDDSPSKERGGEYIFPRGQMVAEFEAAAFSLNTNQVSDLVTTKFGYHIIKLSEKIPAKKTPFAEAQDKIKDYLQQQEADKLLPAYLDKVKKEAGVEYLVEKPKP